MSHVLKWRVSVGCAALLILLMYAQGSLCGVPVPGAVPFTEAIQHTWTWANVSYSMRNHEVLREMPFLVLAFMLTIAWMFLRGHNLRWGGALIAVLLPFLVDTFIRWRQTELIMIFVEMPPIAVQLTWDMLFKSLDHEAWDTVTYAAMTCWAILWLAVLIVETIFWFRRQPAVARGFEPIVTRSDHAD